MFVHIITLLFAVCSMFGPSNAGQSDQFNEIGKANIIPPMEAVGNKCRTYCRLSMNIAAITCRLNATLLPNTPIAPENKNWSYFNPYCWCLSPYVMNYTPRCLWCLNTFKILPVGAQLMSDAFNLCVNKPLNIPACPLDCGALAGYASANVAPCVRDAVAGGLSTTAASKRCWCTKTAQSLVETCRFCLEGWNRTASQEVTKPLNVCRGTFTAEERPKTASGKQLTSFGPKTATIITAVISQASKALSKQHRDLVLPTSTSTSGPTPVAMSALRGGPAEGYYDSVPTAAVKVHEKASEAPPISPGWWWSTVIFEIILIALLWAAGVFRM